MEKTANNINQFTAHQKMVETSKTFHAAGIRSGAISGLFYAAPSPYRTWFVPDASSGPWLNLHYALAAACPNCYARLHGRTKKVDYSTKKTYTIFVCSKIRMIENNKAETT